MRERPSGVSFVVVSAPLIDELKSILHSKIGIPQEIISDFVEVMTQDSILSEDTKMANININDKKDKQLAKLVERVVSNVKT